MISDLKISDQTLDLANCVKKVSLPESGGVQIFLGTVRNQTQGKSVLFLEYEAYEPMAIKEMSRIVTDASAQWPLHAVAVHHRIGRLNVGETAVIIAVSAAHRTAAIDACRFIINTLKARVPIWKKEFFADGAVWVSAFP